MKRIFSYFDVKNSAENGMLKISQMVIVANVVLTLDPRFAARADTIGPIQPIKFLLSARFLSDKENKKYHNSTAIDNAVAVTVVAVGR